MQFNQAVVKRFIKTFIAVFFTAFAGQMTNLLPTMDIAEAAKMSFGAALLMAIEKSFQENL